MLNAELSGDGPPTLRAVTYRRSRSRAVTAK